MRDAELQLLVGPCRRNGVDRPSSPWGRALVRFAPASFAEQRLKGLGGIEPPTSQNWGVRVEGRPIRARRLRMSAALQQEAELTSLKRFSLGGLGGLLPLMVGLAAYDIGAVIDNPQSLTFGTYCGKTVQTTILFLLGGIVAGLNNDVRKPITLVQLGIAAPALLTSWMYSNALSPKTQPQRISYGILSSAHAADATRRNDLLLAGGFFDELVRGATRPLGAVPDRTLGKGDVARAAREQAAQFSVTDRSMGTCFTTSVPLPGSDGEQALRRSFPSPTYEVQRGPCVRSPAK